MNKLIKEENYVRLEKEDKKVNFGDRYIIKNTLTKDYISNVNKLVEAEEHFNHSVKQNVEIIKTVEQNLLQNGYILDKNISKQSDYVIMKKEELECLKKHKEKILELIEICNKKFFQCISNVTIKEEFTKELNNNTRRIREVLYDIWLKENE